MYFTEISRNNYCFSEIILSFIINVFFSHCYKRKFIAW